ncbi:hypothetical protein [Parasitella parasitica]|uniref:Uncharacterized protein n=1 Tax=Parasitella parasitica TaxID=35722 RepID=A0A0B7MUK7_9FUNG|nr:hypothetical protein [Parasitella parasitica]
MSSATNSNGDQPNSNQSTREAMRQFMGRFRLQDNSLMSFTPEKRAHIKKFQEFVSQKANGTCSVCLRVLYPEERRFRLIQNIESLNCFAWNIIPLTRIASSGATEYMVCLDHYKEKDENRFPKYVYPGALREIEVFKRHEKSTDKSCFYL